VAPVYGGRRSDPNDCEHATPRPASQCESALRLDPPGGGKRSLAQALGLAALQQGHRALCRKAHAMIQDLADACLEGTRKPRIGSLAGRHGDRSLELVRARERRRDEEGDQ